MVPGMIPGGGIKTQVPRTFPRDKEPAKRNSRISQPMRTRGFEEIKRMMRLVYSDRGRSARDMLKLPWRSLGRLKFPVPCSAPIHSGLSRNELMIQGLFFLLGKIHGPVAFPCYTTIRRKGLFPTRRGRCDTGPLKANLDGDTIQNVISVEGSLAPFKPPLYRNIQTVGGAIVQPPDCPIVTLGIIGAQGNRPIRTIRQIENIVIHIALSAQNGLRVHLPGKFLPVFASAKAFL